MKQKECQAPFIGFILFIKGPENWPGILRTILFFPCFGFFY